MRSVQFHDQLSDVREFEVDEDVPNDTLWFSNVEYSEIKRNSRAESRDWRKIYGHMLKDSYERPRDDVEDFLLAFCLMNGDSYRRGLERQCNRQHSEERSDVKDRSRFLVLSLQGRLWRQKQAITKIEQQIADAYVESSIAAKTFAIRIAKADEIVAMGKMDAEQTPDMVVPVLSKKMPRRASGISIQSGNSCDSRLLARRPVTPRKMASSPSSVINDDTYAAIA